MLDVLLQVFQHPGTSINSWDAITCKYHMVTYEKVHFICRREDLFVSYLHMGQITQGTLDLEHPMMMMVV